MYCKQCAHTYRLRVSEFSGEYARPRVHEKGEQLLLLAYFDNLDFLCTLFSKRVLNFGTLIKSSLKDMFFMELFIGYADSYVQKNKCGNANIKGGQLRNFGVSGLLSDVHSGLVKIINTLRNVNYICNINLFSSLIFGNKNLF